MHGHRSATLVTPVRTAGAGERSQKLVSGAGVCKMNGAWRGFGIRTSLGRGRAKSKLR
jgi:hypothetical protein